MHGHPSRAARSPSTQPLPPCSPEHIRPRTEQPSRKAALSSVIKALCVKSVWSRVYSSGDSGREVEENHVNERRKANQSVSVQNSAIVVASCTPEHQVRRTGGQWCLSRDQLCRSFSRTAGDPRDHQGATEERPVLHPSAPPRSLSPATLSLERISSR